MRFLKPWPIPRCAAYYAAYAADAAECAAGDYVVLDEPAATAAAKAARADYEMLLKTLGQQRSVQSGNQSTFRADRS